MKQTILLVFLAFSTVIFSQETPPPPPVLDENGELMDSICYMPDSKGFLGDGPEGLTNYLMESMNYPRICLEEGIEGKVVVFFLVETDGGITHIRVTKSAHPLLDEEALRIVKEMPNWTPAMKDGSPARTAMYVPFVFRLD